MRCKGSSIDDSVPGVPTTIRAGTIKQHLDPTLNAERDFLQPAARAKKLIQGEDRECGWNNPADRIRKPRPAIFAGVETNVAIGGTKFPFPEPIPFPANAVHEPVKAFQPGWYCCYQIIEGHYRQRSDPSTLLIISGEDWPTAIGVLGVEQKVLSTFDV